MSLFVPPTATNLPEWVRKVASALNKLLSERDVLTNLAAAPTNPVAGQSYFNITTHKAQVFDGTAWQDLW